MNKTIQIEVIYGDLTKFHCDAIVNSANPSLLAGSGLCGALHKAAGKNLESECMALSKCEVGKAKLTKAYDLSKNGVGWVVHGVAPRWFGGMQNEESMLKETYKSCIDIVKNYGDIYRNQILSILKAYFVKEELEKELLEVDEYIEYYPIKHIAFPAIGVGIYHFPLELSVQIAKEVLEKESANCMGLEKISIVCSDEKVYKVYDSIFNTKV